MFVIVFTSITLISVFMKKRIEFYNRSEIPILLGAFKAFVLIELELRFCYQKFYDNHPYKIDEILASACSIYCSFFITEVTIEPVND